MTPRHIDPKLLQYPVIHHAKVPFRPEVRIPAEFSRHAETIRRLDEELNEVYLQPSDYFQFVNEALAANIHYSTKLEGNPLTEEEVRDTTRRLLDTPEPVNPGDPAPIQEIYTHLFLWLQPETSRPPWKVSTILNLHRGLFHGIEPDAMPGQFRINDEGEFGIYSTQDQLTFKPCPARHVPREVESLLEWRNEIAPGLHPIVAATVFYHEFESIHPFENGNGRLGRTLFHYILHHGGLRNAHLCLIEPELLKDRERYYALLAWADQENDYQPIIDHVAQGLLRAYQKAAEKWKERDLLTAGLSEIDIKLIVRARHSRRPFNVKDATGWVGRRSEQTIRNHLNDMVDRGIIHAEGRTVAKRYQLVDPLRAIRNFLEEMEAAADANAPTAMPPTDSRP